MSKSPIELHAREVSDFATLRALRVALERRGVRLELTAAPGLGPDADGWPASGCAAGPLPCLLRVQVAGPVAVDDQSSRRCAVIVDEIDPPWRLLPPELPDR